MIDEPIAGWRARRRPREPLPLQHLAISFALLATAGASFGLFCALMTLPQAAVTSLVSKNTLLPADRMLFLRSFGVGLLGPPLAGAVFLLGRGGAGPLRRTADLMSPLAATAFVPSLLSYQAWYLKPLPYLVQLVAFAIVLEFTLRRAIDAVPAELGDALSEALSGARLGPARHLPLALVCAAAAGYAWFASHYTILHHRRFGTASFDLGINVNWMYNAMHGALFRCTVLFGPDGGNFIAGHAIFAALFLWLPVYALKPGAEVLLIYQAVMVGFAAVPLYLFAATQLPRWSAAVVALAYLLYAPLHGPNFYDFHELPIAIFFHFWLYYAIARRKTALAVANVVVLYLLREDVPVGLAVLGAFLLLTGARPRFGLWLAVASAAWFVTIKFVIMPWAGSWWFANIYQDLMPAGEKSYAGVIKTLLTNPIFTLNTLLREAKVIYFLHLFAPLAMLPARRPLLLFVALPGAFFTLLTTGYLPSISIAFQYTTHWVPYLFGASVLALRLLGAGPGGVTRRRAALGAMAGAMLCHSYVYGAVLQHNTFIGGFQKIEFSMSRAEQKRYDEFRQIAALIPESASVASTEAENAHLAARMSSFSLRFAHGDSDYLLLHKPQLESHARALVKAAFARSTYGLAGRSGADYFLFKKNHASPETADALRELGLSPDPPAP